MSVDKFSKHQRSRKAKFVINDKNGQTLFTANSEKEYLEQRREFMKKNPKIAQSKAARLKAQDKD